MGIARDLVALERSLRAQVVDPFAAIEQSGLLRSPEVAQVLGRVQQRYPDDSVDILLLCLQTLRVQFDELSPELVQAELVATLPAEVPGIARTTNGVVREMLQTRVEEAILLGYEFTDKRTVELLAGAASAGARIMMICDRGRGSARRVLSAWPRGTQKPRVFQDRKRIGRAPHSSMHAKCLLVNGNDLLITSANFTFHGLHGNVEIGVRLSGPPASEARKIFSYLVEHGLVEEIA